MKPTLDLSVYLVTDPRLCRDRDLVDIVVAAVRGGATVVQLRDKHACDRALVRQGLALRKALDGTGALLIVNDRIDVAAAAGAHGVHIGQSDAAAAEARDALGPHAIVGVSIHNVEQAARLEPGLIDYVGVGPVFATGTKPDHDRPLGFAGLAAICAASPLPVVAIGGLRASHVASALDAGARGVAVVSAICGAPDPEAAAREFAIAARRARATAQWLPRAAARR